MMQHQDPRGQQTPQFPPPGFTGEQVPQHIDPHSGGAPLPQPYQPTDLRTAEPYPGLAGTVPADESTDAEYGDYFGFDLRHKYVMPDGRQWIEFRVLDEGGIAQYHTILDRDVTVEKMTGNARIRINQVQERHALLRVACVDWFMVQRDRTGKQLPVKFNNAPGGAFMQWMLHANPEIVADLYEAVQKVNPALLPANQDTIEAIDKQVEELTRQRAILVERMAGKSDSVNS